jgi:hypothetical protein
MLEELAAKITPMNRHKEIRTHVEVGGEMVKW